MKKVIPSLIALILGAALIGCGVKPPIAGRSDPYDRRQINFSSDDLAGETAVGTPIVTRDSFGLLHVTVPIRAATDLELHVDCRITFFTSGQPVEAPMLKTINLKPNLPQDVTFNSTQPADNFQVDFSYAK